MEESEAADHFTGGKQSGGKGHSVNPVRGLPPVGRIEEDAFIIDLRTVLDHDLPVICRGIQNILNKE